MLKALAFFIFICTCIPETARAQDIYFCSDYTVDGEAKDPSNTWNLDEKGRYIYILFSNHNKHIKSKGLVMNVMKQSGNVYKNYEKRAMKLQGERTWAVLDYQFIDPGNYEIIIKDNKGKDIASNYISVVNKASPKDQNKDIVPLQKSEVVQDPDRSYYNAKTVFCRSVVNGIPRDTGSVLRAGEVNVMVINDKALASDSMIVDVFKKGYETEKFPIYVTSKNFKIDGSLNKTYFSLTLDQTGEYRIVCYNRVSQAICEGFLTIR